MTNSAIEIIASWLASPLPYIRLEEFFLEIYGVKKQVRVKTYNVIMRDGTIPATKAVLSP